MTIVLHPDRYIKRTKPLKAATIEMLEHFMDESDALLAASYKRGDRANDPMNKLGYQFRYYAYLVRDLYLAHQRVRRKLAKLEKATAAPARKPALQKKKKKHTGGKHG